MRKHILKVAPKAAKLVFENDVVRVMVITMKKGERFGPHSYRRGITYNMDGSRIRAKEVDGETNTVRLRKGEASWTDDGESLGVENLGQTFRVLSVELKQAI
jgi:hypothetical protein